MYQYRLDFPCGTRIIQTILKEGETYQMVNSKGELEDARFGGSSRGLVANDGGSVIDRTFNPYSGCMTDYETYIDSENFWDFITDRLDADCDEAKKPKVTVTIRNGQPVAESDPHPENEAA
jgi:hypothetical protein